MSNVFCRYCGEIIKDSALTCPHCHEEQNIDTVLGGVPSENAQGIIAFVICFFFGIFGVHRFVYGRPASGILMLLTMGGVCIWWLCDLISIFIGKFHDGDGNVLNSVF